MSHHQKETAFLRHCLRYEASVEHEALDAKIVQIQRDERCVRSAAWLMALLTALAVAGLCYSAVFVVDFPPGKSHLTVKVFGTLGLASLISCVVFAGFWGVHRKKLHQHREEGRRLATKFMEARFGQPVTTALSALLGPRDGEEAGRTVLVADALVGAPVKTDPAVLG